MSLFTAPDAVFSTAIAALKADAGCVAVFGGRVFDVPTRGEPLPYAYLGPARVQFERAHMCARAWRFTFRIYVVGDEHDRLAAWRAAFAICEALHERDFEAPPGFAFVGAWDAAQGGDIVDPLKLKECYVDVSAVVALAGEA